MQAPIPRVLSFTTVFPRGDDPMRGVFVRSRLMHLAELAPVTVVAPAAVIEYGNPTGRFRPLSQIPKQRQDGPLTVLHPRWLYPPGVKALHPAALALCSARTVLRAKRRGSFDVLDAHFGHPDGIAAALLASLIGVPFTVTLRGSELMHAAAVAVRGELGWALRRASRVIAVSRPLEQLARGLGVAPERIVVIPNGVDSATFRPLDRAWWRARLGMAEERLHILSAGHLIELKGHHRIVAALPRLHAAGLPAELWIAGAPGNAGAFDDTIRRTAEECGVAAHVHFTGPLQPGQIAGAMNASDLLCLASSREGSPNVVNEALACGVPVVATSVGGVPDMLPDERFGIVVPAGDPESLAAGLDTALRRQWDRAAIAAWGARRSWNNVAAETLEALQGAVLEWAERTR
ncbi:MAG: glycosyltransferase [Acidobacteria bacterium]|nr:glycosyltransferase [Acidobacteriota bacterium]